MGEKKGRTLPAGSIITCRSCMKSILITTKPIRYLEKLEHHMFKYPDDSPVEPLTEMRCQECGTGYTSISLEGVTT